MYEPAVYDSVTITHSRSEVYKVPEDFEGIAAVAIAMEESGHVEIRGICEDGFRYRCLYGGDGESTGTWFWASPGDYIVKNEGTRQDPEFDMPSTYLPHYTFKEDDWRSGPKIHEHEMLDEGYDL